MKVIFVLACVVGGGVGGYQLGLWWLDRTVASPELESAVYPGIGTLAGCFIGLLVAISLLWLNHPNHHD